MKEVLIREYNNLENLKIVPQEKKPYTFKTHFVQGAFLEIIGEKSNNFLVQFINQDTGKVIHSNNITNNMWTKTSVKYFVNWYIKVTDIATNDIVYEHKYNAKDKKVYIHFDSQAIGDTLAWFPYSDEFRKKHQCDVTVSTFHNDYFQEKYPELKFVTPGEEVSGIYAMYNVGWLYDENDKPNLDFNPSDFRKCSLQETSAEILGIDFIKDIKPKVSFKNMGSQIEGDYVCIAPHASAHAKYWNYPGGWQRIIDYLNEQGYKVVIITQERLGDDWHDSKLGGTLKNVLDKTGNYLLENRANDIMNAKLFIGVGSGLSWLSWALNTPTILISGFSAPFSEFSDCERIFTPKSHICNSCYNKHKLDAGDWEWCPEHKNTERQFECTKSILPSTVIESIKRQLEKPRYL